MPKARGVMQDASRDMRHVFVPDEFNRSDHIT